MPDPTSIVRDTCDSTSWRRRGACRTAEGRKVIFSTRRALARAMCATCRFAGPCLVEALQEEATAVAAAERFGVRGGLTGPERHQLARGVPAGVEAFMRFARQRARATA
jgi:hypothetical protein